MSPSAALVWPLFFFPNGSIDHATAVVSPRTLSPHGGDSNA
ncbi:hypothetical protein ACS15_5015 [Ralstonia insidiosa]|uniref:Uncharacterized protein n=1 Tax=Ralstonia insidiosa TaxID=190721 RepID=A0AAC9FTY5_9RALS|nr:hypothetical protein ACS15_5015 [Ralstonia insidiosa]